MLYSAGAVGVGLLHLAFIVFVVLGGLLLLRWPKLVWIHFPAAVWGVLIEFAGWYCPLTTTENWLLRKAGRAGYTGGFVSHYIFGIIYPAGLTRPMEIAIGLVVLVLNVSVYAKLWR